MRVENDREKKRVVEHLDGSLEPTVIEAKPDIVKGGVKKDE